MQHAGVYIFSSRSHAFMYVHSCTVIIHAELSELLPLFTCYIMLYVKILYYYIDALYLSMVCSSYNIGSMKLVHTSQWFVVHTI